jgi:cysteine desulfurase
MRKVYLDYSATTPIDPKVLESMVAAFGGGFGNASSVHSFGRDARTLLEQSRESIARAFGARSDEIYFTSGGTESDNHAVKGIAQASSRKGKKEIVITAVEHHAILHPAESLRKEGFDVKYLPVDSYGRVDPSDVKKNIGQKTALVSIMYVNNEVGTITDVRSIGAMLREAEIPFHSDIVQAVGKTKINLTELNLDSASLSAHKFYGPKGIGAIYIRKGTSIDSFIEGGAQESNRRAGTENVPLAVGLAKAAQLVAESMPAEQTRISTLKQRLKNKLLQGFEGLLFNGHPTESVPHILNVSFDSAVRPLDGDALIMGLDLWGVAVTSGSACTSGSLQPSHVLTAIGRDARTARATVRFSIGRYTTEEEIDYAVECLREVVGKIRNANSGM